MVLEHDMYEDHCEFWFSFWYLEDNRWSVMYRPEEFDNGQGMSMGIRMYLGPRTGITSIDPDPVPIPGPPIVIIDVPDQDPPPDPTDPPPEPDPTCNNVFPETCPDNGKWTYNIWQFSNSELTWPSSEKERFKAGAWVAGRVMNSGSIQSCMYQWGVGDFGNGTYAKTQAFSSKPDGQEAYDFLYKGREVSWASESGGTDYQADVKYFRWASLGSGILASSGVPGNYIRFGKEYYTASIRSPSTHAGNMMHEWSHNMGFGHSCACQDSYPYRFGTCVYNAGSSLNTQARNLFPGGNW